MTMRWSEEETLKLIELYKSYRLLWDHTADIYRNPQARRQAYDAIIKQMNMRNLTVVDLKSKIKNLRSSYYYELRKMSKGSHDTMHQRKLMWFHAFKPIMNSITNRKENATDSGSECSDESSEESPFIEDITSNSNSYVVSIKQEYLDEMENQDKETAPSDEYLEPVPKRLKPYEQKKTDRNDYESPSHVVQDIPEAPKPLDEFQLFSNVIAAQLRRLPLDRALIIQVEVQSLVAKERIRMYKKRNEDSKEDDLS